MTNRDPEHVHFVGIGGSGMCPLATIALNRGFKVSGSDPADNKNTKYLTSLGAVIDVEQNGKNLPTKGLVVVSSAVTDGNPEVQAARQRALPIIHRSDFLKQLMAGQKAITIAGTSGKTTVSALIAHMLQQMGLEPTAAIGGTMKSIGQAALWGRGEYFVAEADESDGSFLKYDPFISVLTNIDNDHLDYYKSLEGIKAAFQQYLKRTHPDGAAIIGWDNKQSQIVGSEFEGRRLTYGFRLGSDVRALAYQVHRDGIKFEAMVESDKVATHLPLLGKHNIANALCALAVARALELDINHAAEALTSFGGVSRRFDKVFASDFLKLYDDYAHNPAKIGACVSGMRESYPDFNLKVIFQAHRYSRIDTMYNEICGAFRGADEVWVMPVFAAGEPSLKDFSLHKLAADLANLSNTRTFVAEDLDGLPRRLLAAADRPTVFLTVGAGDVWKLGVRLGEMLHGEAAKIEAGFR